MSICLDLELACTWGFSLAVLGKSELTSHEEEQLDAISGPIVADDFEASLTELQKTHCDGFGAPQVRVCV